MITLIDRQALVAALIPKGAVVAEIGVYRGDFSRQIFDLCQPSKLYCIDAWEKYPEYEKDSLCHTNQDDNCEATKRIMAPEISAGKCEVIRGRSAPVALKWREPLDAIFLDANHAFEFVDSDLRNWHRFIKPGGIFMCHDFTDTSAGAIQMNFGVVKAVNLFVTTHEGWELTHVTQEPDWPSCALTRARP